MMLWDIIRDWFVQYVWGGVTSTGDTFVTSLGMGYNLTDSDSMLALSNVSLYLPIQGIDDNYSVFVEGITFGDWLSSMSTIIILVSLCIFLALCVRYLFKFIGGLFKW